MMTSFFSRNCSDKFPHGWPFGNIWQLCAMLLGETWRTSYVFPLYMRATHRLAIDFSPMRFCWNAPYLSIQRRTLQLMHLLTSCFLCRGLWPKRWSSCRIFKSRTLELMQDLTSCFVRSRFWPKRWSSCRVFKFRPLAASSLIFIYLLLPAVGHVDALHKFSYASLLSGWLLCWQLGNMLSLTLKSSLW